ncbi:MAG: hypothetical protein EBQ94_01020 [Flavobacteriales bacterium]|nr:hypothetical protein [Flavobacteriales bacterium]
MAKRILIYFSLIFLLFSCGNNEKERVTELLKEKIGTQLPFNDVKIAEIENGTAVIVDNDWCFWIDSDDKIYCVNGSSRSVYRVNNPECELAPIKAMYLDIEKLAK